MCGTSVRHFAAAEGNPITALDLNTINLMFLLLGAGACTGARAGWSRGARGAPAAAGVLLQFPFYGGIFGMIVYTGLSRADRRLAGVGVATTFFFPPIIGIYSCVLGIFVPSGG